MEAAARVAVSHLLSDRWRLESLVENDSPWLVKVFPPHPTVADSLSEFLRDGVQFNEEHALLVVKRHVVNVDEHGSPRLEEWRDICLDGEVHASASQCF